MSVKIHYTELEELARVLCELDDNADGGLIYDKIQEKYNIDIDYFSSLISDLLPLIESAKSPLTQKTYKGFASDGLWLVKMEADKNKLLEDFEQTTKLLLEATKNLGHPAYGVSSGTTIHIDELREKCFNFLGVTTEKSSKKE